MFYSLLIKIKPKENGEFKFFTGKKLHGAFLNIIKEANEELAQELHDKDIPKEFTVSNIFGTNSKYFKLEKDKEYYFRVTFLNENLYRIFSSEICKRILQERGIFIENIPLSIEEIIYKDNKYTGVMEEGEKKRAKRYMMSFKTPTLFKCGDYYLRYPELNYLFKSLLKKYNLYSSKKIEESILENLYEINFEKIDIRLKKEQLNKFFIEGFVGDIIIRIDSKNENFLEAINTLINFSFYSGVGTKSSIGFGQVIIKKL